MSTCLTSVDCLEPPYVLEANRFRYWFPRALSVSTTFSGHPAGGGWPHYPRFSIHKFTVSGPTTCPPTYCLTSQVYLKHHDGMDGRSLQQPIYRTVNMGIFHAPNREAHNKQLTCVVPCSACPPEDRTVAACQSRASWHRPRPVGPRSPSHA